MLGFALHQGRPLRAHWSVRNAAGPTEVICTLESLQSKPESSTGTDKTAHFPFGAVCAIAWLDLPATEETLELLERKWGRRVPAKGEKSDWVFPKRIRR
jgi:hypothetical protein